MRSIDLRSACVDALAGIESDADKFQASLCIHLLVCPDKADSFDVTLPAGFRNWDEVALTVAITAIAQAKLEASAPTLTEELIKTSANDPDLTLEELRQQGLVGFPDASLETMSAKEFLRTATINFRDLVNFCRAVDKRRDSRNVPPFYMSADFTMTDQWVVFDGGVSLAACDNESAALLFSKVMESPAMTAANFSRKKTSLGLVSLTGPRLKLSASRDGLLLVKER